MFGKVLVATDGSIHSQKAEDYALNLAKKYGSKLWGIYVIDETRYKWAEEIMADVRSKVKKEGEKVLKNFSSLAEKEGLPADTVIKEGDPSQEIVRFSRGEGIELIVMGSRGLTETAERTLGSVAQRVVRRAPCPVLVIR